MNRMKRGLAFFVCAVITVCSLNAVPAMAGAQAKAADNSYTKAEADGYIKDGTYPAAPSGEVFAGWYQDEDYAEPYTGNASVEKVYAKYVDENVLSVKCQITAGTESESAQTNLRMVTTVDSLNYQQVGFDVTIDEKTNSFTSKTVYTTLNGYIDGNENKYLPTVFSAASQFFMSYKLTEIPNAAFSKDITITVKWTTMDGAVVYGAPRTLTIDQIIGADEKPLEEREFTKTISHTAGQNTDWNLVMDIPEYPAGSVVSYDVVSTAGIKTATWYYQRYMEGDTKKYEDERYSKIFTGGELSTGEITTTKAINSLFIKVRIWGSDSNIPTGDYQVTIKNIKITPLEEREFTKTISHTAGQNTDWNFVIDIPEYAAGAKVSYDVVSTAGVKTATFYFQRYMNGTTQAYANEKYAKIFTGGELSTGEITTDKAINSLYIKVRIWGSDSNIPTGNYPVTIKNIKIQGVENGL